MLAVLPYIVTSAVIILAISIPVFFIIIPAIKNSRWLSRYIENVEKVPTYTETPQETMNAIADGKKELKGDAQTLKKQAKQQAKDAANIEKFLDKK